MSTPSPRGRRRAAAALAAALLTVPAAAAPADAKVRVGIGDQSLRMFADPVFKALDLRQIRYFVRWDVMRHRDDRLRMRAWVLAAREQGMRPLVHVSTNSFVVKEAPLPSKDRYRKDVGRLVRYLRRLGVRDFGAWNEANHKTQPTWDVPDRAGSFFKIMWNDVFDTCTTRSCRVVALDVLDQRGKERYIERFFDHLRTRTWKRRARIIGLHNYSDVNRDSRTRTRDVIREVHDHNPEANIWFTETGGLVGFGRSFKCDPNEPRVAEERAARAVDNVFDLARIYDSAGVQRVYLYNWYGNDCAPNERTNDPQRGFDERAGFDAGLVRADGTPRPALKVFVDALERARFDR